MAYLQRSNNWIDSKLLISNNRCQKTKEHLSECWGQRTGNLHFHLLPNCLWNQRAKWRHLDMYIVLESFCPTNFLGGGGVKGPGGGARSSQVPRGLVEARSPRRGRRLWHAGQQELFWILPQHQPDRGTQASLPSSDFPLLNASPALFSSPLSGLW